MENDPEEKIINDWNTLNPNMTKNSFNAVYRALKQFAEKNGRQSRIEGYNYMDGLNKENKGVVEMQQKNRRVGGRELLELWMRAKKWRQTKKVAK